MSLPSIFPLSPENEFAMQIIALGATTAVAAIAHTRIIIYRAGRRAAAEFDARMRRLDLLMGSESQTTGEQ